MNDEIVMYILDPYTCTGPADCKVTIHEKKVPVSVCRYPHAQTQTRLNPCWLVSFKEVQPEQYTDSRRAAKMNDPENLVESSSEAWRRSNTH
jgi:hypothetical protein